MGNDTPEPHEELNELLNDEAPVDLNSAPEKEEKGEPEPVVEPEPEPEVPPTPEPDPDARFNAMLAKSQDEVAKRQAAEARAQALEQQIAQQKPEPLPDLYDNPEEFAAKIESRIEGKVSQALQQERMNSSEIVMRATVGDESYDEAVNAFVEAAKTDQALGNAAFSSPAPAKYAYDQGKAILFKKEVGNDPAAYRAKVEAEVREKLLAEQGVKNTAQQSQADIDALPQTIANSGTAPPSTDQLPDDDLASLLGES